MQFTQSVSNNPSAWTSGSSAAYGSVNAITQGYQQSRLSNYNAALLQNQAKTVALQTGSQVSQIRRQGENTLAQQAAGFADNGTGTGGSNALIQRSAAIDTEMDAASANYNGQLQVNDLQNQASALRMSAKAQKPSFLSLLGAGLNTAGAFASAGGLKSTASKAALITRKDTYLKR